MPWLVRDKDDPSKDLLFVHVPRCGGTSLTKHFNLPQKARAGRDPWHWFGMVYFFYRYWLLETANFPILSVENLIFATEYVVAILLLFLDVDSAAPYSLFATGGFMFLTSTFLFTAPVVGRNKVWRRFYGVFTGRLLCNFVGNNTWLTGTSHKGFLVHFTAPKMLKHGFVTEDDLDRADSFAIVRNPYSRMVSIFMYNRLGPLESFKSFAKDWVHNKMSIYNKTGSTEEWDIYCHAVPAHEFTHCQGQQVVKCIVKQEELKSLWPPGVTTRSLRHSKRLSEIPPKVAEALRGMPHSNQRSRSKPWWDYYDQETQDLVAKAYAKDFAYFGYDIALPNRPDLKPPPLEPMTSIRPFSSNLDFSIIKKGSIARMASSRGGLQPPQPVHLQPVSEASGEESGASASIKADIALLEMASSGAISRQGEGEPATASDLALFISEEGSAVSSNGLGAPASVSAQGKQNGATDEAVTIALPVTDTVGADGAAEEGATACSNDDDAATVHSDEGNGEDSLALQLE